MKYRITEFKTPNAEGNMFFVETGTVYQEKYWAFIYVKKVNWRVVSGYKTFEDALSAIEEIKANAPVIHEIK